MVFTPVMYTNVSDAWTLPRRERLLVTAAGILVELGIAAAATILWWYAAPGLTKSLLLNTMVMCSVNTIVFNGNPLLRFDGYFLLMDAVGIPNLASRAGLVLRETVIRLLTGTGSSSSLAETRQRFLLTYGVLSAGYRLLLMMAILHVVKHMAEEWRVQFVGEFLTASIMLGFIVMPLVQFLKRLSAHTADHRTGWTPWYRMIGVLCILITALLYPLPHSVVAPAIVRPDSTAMYASVAGRLHQTAGYHRPLRQGQVVVRLTSPELDRRREQLRGQIAQRESQLETLQRNPATANSELLPTLKESLKSARRQLEEFETDYADLTIAAAQDGVFLPPPATNTELSPDIPTQWYGTPASPKNVGAWIERGTLLGYAGTPGQVVLQACVGEADIEFLQADCRAEYCFPGGQTDSTEVIVDTVGRLQSKDVPVQFAAAGRLSGDITDRGFVPHVVTYQVDLRWPDQAPAPPPALYSVGSVRIYTRPVSVVQRFVRYLRRTFG